MATWMVVAVLVGVLIGRIIRRRDRQQPVERRSAQVPEPHVTETTVPMEPIRRMHS